MLLVTRVWDLKSPQRHQAGDETRTWMVPRSKPTSMTNLPTMSCFSKQLSESQPSLNPYSNCSWNESSEAESQQWNPSAHRFLLSYGIMICTLSVSSVNKMNASIIYHRCIAWAHAVLQILHSEEMHIDNVTRTDPIKNLGKQNSWGNRKNCFQFY